MKTTSQGMTERTESASEGSGPADQTQPASTKRSADLKLLLACKSCQRDAHLHKLILETWGKDVPVTVPLLFFIGGPTLRDVLTSHDRWLDECPDDYLGLPLKTKAILKYALKKEYDYVFLFDIDTFVRPDLLLSSNFTDYDYYGLLGGYTDNGRYHNWCSGCGYWLSKKAMRIVVNDLLVKDWAEDRMVGQILGPYITSKEITAGNDNRYAGRTIDGESVGEIVCHFAAEGTRRKFNPEWMIKKYEAWKNGQG